MNTTLLNLVRVVSILDTPIPTISDTSALNPDPFVSSWLNDVRSPTLYPVPPSKIVILSIPPLVTASIFDICLIYSLDSSMKSLSANSSPTLYGLVFLTKFELLKLKSCVNTKLSFITGDL